MSQPVKKKKKAKLPTPSPAASGSGDSAASDQSLVVSAPETDAAEPPAQPADPLAIDNFALSPAIKALLRKKGIEALFQIQVSLGATSADLSLPSCMRRRCDTHTHTLLCAPATGRCVAAAAPLSVYLSKRRQVNPLPQHQHSPSYKARRPLSTCIALLRGRTPKA